jgi:alpha-1,6-mannosyltransferase
VPAIAFYHSDLPRLVRPRFGQTAEGVTCKYLSHLYRQFDLVLAPSRAMVEQLGEMGVPDAVHQPLGIDSSVFHPRAGSRPCARTCGFPRMRACWCTRGASRPEKKLPLLIEAVRKLGRPYHLLMIGGGIELPRYPQITHLPFKRDQRHLARLLASCDVLVHPGDCETFGLIVLEAMACGLPVVATTGGGVAELVDEHRASWRARTASTAWPMPSRPSTRATWARWACQRAAQGGRVLRLERDPAAGDAALPGRAGRRGQDEPGARSVCVTD